MRLTLTNELAELIAQLIGPQSSNTVYVTGNLGSLAKIRMPKNKKLQAVYDSIGENFGENGTIFSPAASMNLCNTSTPFDPDNTPSYRMGALAEFIRLQCDSIRSLHPFWSICGVGPEAEGLKNTSKHAYGAGSPWSHFLDLDTIQINFGLHPSKAVTLIHHIETVVGVPYRYTKEFCHPIILGDELVYENFYMSVKYREANVQKKIKLNQHYFQSLEAEGLLRTAQHSCGLCFWAFKMRDFYRIALKFFNHDIYNYLEVAPHNRPYAR